MRHIGTNTVFFEKRETLLKSIETALDSCVSEYEQGYPFNIIIGCSKDCKNGDEMETTKET
jgi:hypothetical protein